MKTKIALILAVLISAFSFQPSALASGYALSNDLQASFTLFYWTNSGAGNVFSLITNTPPGNNYVVSIPTNGPAGLGLQPTNATMFILVPWTNMPYASNNVSSFFTNALAAIAPASETVPQWQMILKSYFVTGAIPNQANYWELIDTIFYYVNAMYLNSVSAQSNAQYIVTITQQRAYIEGNCMTPGGGSTSFSHTNSFAFGCFDITTNSPYNFSSPPPGYQGYPSMTVQFTIPFADTNYIVQGFWDGVEVATTNLTGGFPNMSLTLSSRPFVTARTTTNCILAFGALDGNWHNYYFIFTH